MEYRGCQEWDVLIPFRSGLLWNDAERFGFTWDDVLIPFRSGLLWNFTQKVKIVSIISLNPL